MYQPDETIRLEVRMEGETVWLSQAQMAELFGTKRPAITKHLNNIYKCGELKEESTCSILEHMGNDGKQLYTTRYYNLDAIISVGFRVNTKRGIEFRQWANKVLKDYLLKGYVVNQRISVLEHQVADWSDLRRLRADCQPHQAGKTLHHPHRQLHRRGHFDNTK